MKINDHRVLLCPLNWGLGHAARCIPLINSLIKLDATVIIAGTGASQMLLKEEFPSLQFIDLPSPEINYNANGFSILKMLAALPQLLWSTYTEHKRLQKIINENKITWVISDNRYGLYSRKVISIFITHQLFIQLPVKLKWLSPVVNSMVHFFAAKFNQCWVPDEKGDENISGVLSHGKSSLNNLHFIGPLTRFNETVDATGEKKYEVLVVLSGPEPQRTILEEKLSFELKKINKETLIVRGLPGTDSVSKSNGNITFVNHLLTPVLNFHLINAGVVICRSGYSSLMDLASLGRSAIIIPTPGQTEQEYLAAYHHHKNRHYMLLQSDLRLKEAFEGIKNCRSLKMKSRHLEENLLKVLDQ